MKSNDGDAMNHDPVSQTPGEAADAHRDVKHDTRRRKLLGSVAASPLLLSISSRPAWANGGMCTPSALASANLSGQHDFSGCGIATAWWMANEAQWPISPGTYFHGIFAKVTFDGKVLFEETQKTPSPTTLSDVIKGNFRGVNPGGIASPLIGAYLNALAFPSSGGAPGYPFPAKSIVDAFNALQQVSTLSAKDKSAQDSSPFASLSHTLDTANNLYDANTAKPAI